MVFWGFALIWSAFWFGLIVYDTTRWDITPNQFTLDTLISLAIWGVGMIVAAVLRGTRSRGPTLAGPRADGKVCPRCAETVKAAALICRYCGHEFEPGEPEAPKGNR
jgi:hypothetical protein